MAGGSGQHRLGKHLTKLEIRVDTQLYLPYRIIDSSIVLASVAAHFTRSGEKLEVEAITPGRHGTSIYGHKDSMCPLSFESFST